MVTQNADIIAAVSGHNGNERFIARSPGGIGNIGPGLDVLGCAVEGPTDEVTAEWWDEPGIFVRDPGHPDLPRSPARHTSAIAAAAVLHEALRRGARLQAAGIALTVRKGLPLSGGQGGSAASAVAGATAANALLGSKLEINDLLACCLAAEAKVAGRHLDNIAPSLLGGIILVKSINPIVVIRLPVPHNLHLILAHPEQRLATATARRALPESVDLHTVTHQMAQTAAMVAACYTNDVALFGASIDDTIAEPARARLLPGFFQAKKAAMQAGALGASISGAGPTAFAVSNDLTTAEGIASAMQSAYAAAGIPASIAVTRIDDIGTVVTRA